MPSDVLVVARLQCDCAKHEPRKPAENYGEYNGTLQSQQKKHNNKKNAAGVAFADTSTNQDCNIPRRQNANESHADEDRDCHRINTLVNRVIAHRITPPPLVVVLKWAVKIAKDDHDCNPTQESKHQERNNKDAREDRCGATKGLRVSCRKRRYDKGNDKVYTR